MARYSELWVVWEGMPGYTGSNTDDIPVFTSAEAAVDYLKATKAEWEDMDWRIEGTPETGQIDAYDDEMTCSHRQTAYIDHYDTRAKVLRFLEDSGYTEEDL